MTMTDPTDSGRFGDFGGMYVPETLVPALDRLEAGIRAHLHEEGFQACLGAELRDWAGRPTALTPAPALGRAWGAEVWLKLENLQYVTSFKQRGAFVKLTALNEEERARGVIAVSAGTPIFCAL